MVSPFQFMKSNYQKMPSF